MHPVSSPCLHDKYPDIKAEILFYSDFKSKIIQHKEKNPKNTHSYDLWWTGVMNKYTALSLETALQKSFAITRGSFFLFICVNVLWWGSRLRAQLESFNVIIFLIIKNIFNYKK